MKIEKALANIQLLGTQVKKIEFENDFIVFYEQDDTKKYLDVSYNIKECSYDEKAILEYWHCILKCRLKMKKKR